MEGVSSVCLSGGGDITMTGGSISAMGLGTRAVSATGANMTLTGVAIEGASGIWLGDSNQLDLSGSTVKTDGIALDINGRSNAMAVADSPLHSTGDGVGIVVMFADSTLAMAGSAIIGEGNRTVGIDVQTGLVDLERVDVTTSGESSHGLYADFTASGTNPTINARAAQVHTFGTGAIGAVARKGGSNHLQDGAILTEGREAHGVLTGGNGIANTLDAAVAGRFDVMLQGHSQMVGDIVITPEDEDAGLEPQSDGHWYLRSQWFDRCATEPAYPGCVIDPDPEGGGDGGIPITPPVPVLRPEVGAFLANQSAAVGMFAHRMHERRGADTRQAGRSAWVRVGRQQADFSAVGRQLAVDGNTNVVQVGSDLLGGQRTAFGVMVGSGRSDSTAVSGLTGYRATGRVRGTAVGVYGIWLQQPGQTIGAYLDGSAQWARFDNRVAGDGLLQERYDSKAMSASLEAGYTFAAWQGPSSTVYLQPQLQLSWVDFSADAHVEQNGTRVDAGRAGHLAGRVGLRVFGHGTPAGNVVQPYAGVNWLRGSATRTLDFNGETLGADVPRSRYEVQVGAELTLRPHWSAWAGMAVQHGDGGYRSVGGQLGIRRAW